MEEKYYYVYEWYNAETNEVFYVGKGCRGRSGQVTRRNDKFKEYYNHHLCAVRKIAYFDDEDEALAYEHKTILAYKAQGQAIANLDDGGKGGCNFVWTEELRQYKSEHNPMKEEEQRQRMREQNPMFSAEIAEKVSNKISRAIIIDNQEYKNAREVSLVYQVSDSTIRNWCDAGHSPSGLKCNYKDEHNKSTRKRETYKSSRWTGIYVDDVYYETLKDAANANNFVYSTFIQNLKRGNMNFKGHTCKYANQQPSQENNQ